MFKQAIFLPTHHRFKTKLNDVFLLNEDEKQPLSYRNPFNYRNKKT